MEAWIEFVRSSGLAVAIVVAICVMLWRGGKWLGPRLFGLAEELIRKHIELVGKMTLAIDKMELTLEKTEVTLERLNESQLGQAIVLKAILGSSDKLLASHNPEALVMPIHEGLWHIGQMVKRAAEKNDVEVSDLMYELERVLRIAKV